MSRRCPGCCRPVATPFARTLLLLLVRAIAQAVDRHHVYLSVFSAPQHRHLSDPASLPPCPHASTGWTADGCAGLPPGWWATAAFPSGPVVSGGPPPWTGGRQQLLAGRLGSAGLLSLEPAGDGGLSFRPAVSGGLPPSPLG